MANLANSYGGGCDGGFDGGCVLFWHVLASPHFAFMGFNLTPAFSCFDLPCHIFSHGGCGCGMLSNAFKKTIGQLTLGSR